MASASKLLLDLSSASAERVREAALHLGLLLERRWAKRQPGDDGGLAAIVGVDGIGALDETEVDAVVGSLVEALDKSPPEPMLAWALSKAKTGTAVGALWSVLETHCRSRDPVSQATALNAWHGITMSFLPEWRVRVRELQLAAVGEVASEMSDFLALR